MSRGLLSRACCVVLLCYVAVAVFAPWLAPYDPLSVTGKPFTTPDKAHPLGTNATGQDILSQMIYGTRVTLFVGFGLH